MEHLIEERRATLHCLDGGNGDTPDAVAMRGMKAVVAEYERALIRLRINSAIAMKRAKGQCLGPVPDGYVADAAGPLHADAAEQEVVVDVRATHVCCPSITPTTAPSRSRGP